MGNINVPVVPPGAIDVHVQACLRRCGQREANLLGESFAQCVFGVEVVIEHGVPLETESLAGSGHFQISSFTVVVFYHLGLFGFRVLRELVNLARY